MKLIIFSDLDGTLLNLNTYSFKEAKPALKLIKKKKIPLILCTSKTAAETKYYQKKLRIKEPFIVENGGAIYIPKDYFNFDFEYQREEDSYLVIELGTRYHKLRKALKDIREQLPDSNIVGFGDMSLEQLVKDSKLPKKQARLAKIRGYDEPFKFQGDEKRLRELVEETGLHLTRGGRYYHIIGDNDKGKAVRTLSELFERMYEKIIRFAIGDSDTDCIMLDEVEKGYLVQKIDGSYASENYLKAEGVGPVGWRWVIEKEVI